MRSYRSIVNIDPVETVEATTALWAAARRVPTLEVVDQSDEQLEHRPSRFYVKQGDALFRVDVTPTDRMSVR